MKPPLVADHKAGKSPVEDDQEDTFSHVNGAHGVASENRANGDNIVSEASLTQCSTSIGDSSRQLPPEILHIAEGYLPLSNLIARIVQDTFNGMTEVVHRMSELQMSQVNGSAPANHSQANVQKKSSLLNFAQDRRAKFIKILVLSQWSRQAESISKVIDLKIWLSNQAKLYDDACNWMGWLKRFMAQERMPNPDLQSALEALSLGKVSRLPDLGYLPPKHVSPYVLLKTLRSINTLLTIRLRLHETIPPPFRGYSISNGRATFRVPDEFEIDLSIADEDASSQLYFIDFRFLFSPSPAEVPQGHLRGDLEARINLLLRDDGLNGCYRFLHNFVLSHKLNIFRHQAHRMSQGSWSEHLKVEAVHRSLVIQYWVTRPGGKNWIELGIRRQKVKRSSWFQKEEDEPHIGIRWFRSGKEVTDIPLTCNLGDPSVEAIVKQVIAAHTNLVLQEIRARLREGHLYHKRILRLRQTRSDFEPTSSNLLVQFTASQSCTIIQEPVAGRIVLLPPSLLYSRAEREMNSLVLPNKAASACLAHLRATAACEEVERALRCYGWEVSTAIRPNQENLRQHFGRDTLKAGFFRKRSWDAQWLLAFTACLSEDTWWIVELDIRRPRVDPIATLAPSVRAAFKMPSTISGVAQRELSYLELSRIEHTAVGLISQYTDSRQLALQKIPYRLVRTKSNRLSPDLRTLYVHLLKHPAQPSSRNEVSANMQWFSQVVRVSFIGTDKPKSYANHLVVAWTDCAALRSRRLASGNGESVTFHPSSGAYALLLRTTVGKSAIPSLLDSLSRIQRLINYVTTMRTFSIQDLSLQHIEFTYATEPQVLRANIHLDQSTPRLSFRHGNPHLRIQHQLAVLLRKDDGLKHLMLLLSLTIPLLRALVTIEAAHTYDEVIILPRSAEWYQIQYQRPLGRFDLRLRRRRENFMWFVEEASLPEINKLDARAHEQFCSMVKEKGEGWHGISPGIVASPEGVEALLKKIDEIFQHVPTMEPAPSSDGRDHKAQKRKREDDEVVVLD
ncbi:MAG: hypothetical protein Q9186_005702 [Xanthomendoza sp. 1 TL-2023]